MILTIAEDLTSTVTFDSELTSIPSSGMYLNSGVHPSVTVNNLLQFLPKISITFDAYDSGTTYGKYTDSRKRTDIVTDGGKIYQSLTASNVGNAPASNPSNWLETNIESLRIKSFVLKSQDGALSKLHLTRRLIDNQYLYNLVEQNEDPQTTALSGDYSAWVFEPKGSDYVTFRVNQIALQATTAGTVDLYVINQGQLITTITLTTNAEGRLVFEDSGYEFTGKGKWIFAIDSQDVLTDGSTIDPLMFDGFVCYTATGEGATPEGATYTFGTANNGLNWNISAYFNSATYINNNLVDFAQYLQRAWELDVLNMMLSNSNNKSNRDQRIQQVDRQLLMAETKDLKTGSVVYMFQKEKKRAIKMLEKSLDTELNDNEDYEIEITSI